MNLQAKKLDLIRWLTSLNDEKIVSKLYAIKTKAEPIDWYDGLSTSQKKSIAKGLDDSNNGRILSHNEVMLSASIKISELKNR